jgi:hypothetical protein
MSEYIQKLRDIIAAHYGQTDFANCTDEAVKSSIEELANRIDDELLENGVIAGMIRYADLQELMGLSSQNTLAVTIHRDKSFPAPAVDREKLFRLREIKSHLAHQEANQKTGRPRNAHQKPAL